MCAFFAFVSFYLSTIKEIFTSALYSMILLFCILAVHRFTWIPLMFLIVFAASVTAFWAASLQLFGELPISSIILMTVIRFTSINIVLLRALQLFDLVFVGVAIFEY